MSIPKEYAKSIADLDVVVSLDGKNASAWYHRGSTRLGYGMFERDCGRLWPRTRTSNVPSLTPLKPLTSMGTFGKAYLLRGTGWFELKNYDKAISDLTEASPPRPASQ